MALDKNDLKSIKKIVDESVKVEIHKGIGPLRLEMNQRFEQVEGKIDTNQKVVLQKIDEIRKMESEDIQVIYEDIAKIKKRLPA